MNRVLTADRSIRRPLKGPIVQYSDGRIETPPPLNVESILADLEKLDMQERAAFLCIFANDLTVQIRSTLMDRPLSEGDLDRVNRLNEYLHQLTSCMNPNKRWSVRDEAALVRALVESSYLYDLQSAVGSALAKAAGNAESANERTFAEGSYEQVVGAYGEKVVEAELLGNGWLPANVNATVSNTANFDIFAQKGNRVVPIRVKTCGPEAKGFSFSGFPLEREPSANEFTVLVKMGKRRATDRLFVMRTREFHKDIRAFCEASKEAGIKDIGKWTLILHEPRQGLKDHRRYGYGFARKWEKWLNNWKQLEATAEAVVDIGAP
jgi:hypothetical protein